ncbi:uncharacterized protein ELE39_002965 [Cryptosporidium sp. chipmunk genotype I]|uniref:uncharacterized protein n=1 Tax=Cryptosporidium sp. chipmunk genotype I TaxID=1280935 RepID=UPI003519E5FA|nr:hypothetical protein ELE39_002965 [Cryptosporidium sp. chipmunk genotype I]
MNYSREKIQLMASTGLKSYSDDELPVITPCSSPYSSSSLSIDSISNSFAKNFPSIKVYSEQDGTYITFHIKSAETTMADLKNFISSLKDNKRAHNSSMDSQASTMDSDLNSYQRMKESEISLFGHNIQIYGEIPGLTKRIFSDSDRILQAFRETDNLKLYYSNENFEIKKNIHSGLIVIVYPKANLYELGVKCFITVSESGLKFVSEEDGKLYKRIIFISFDDIYSITVYKQIENCFLIKRKTIGKSPFIIRASSSLDFNIIKKSLKQVSEIQKDSKLISDADSRLALSNMYINNVESMASMNALTTFFEFIDSNFGKAFFSNWIKSFEQDSEKFPELKILKEKLENDFNNLIKFKEIKESLLSQEYFLVSEERGLNDLFVEFKRYLSEVSPSVEDILQVN